MKILFVRPHLFDARATDALEPLAFAVLAGLTPPDVSVALRDERLAPVHCDEDADLVAITVETYTARRAYEISARFRARGIPVVVGGYHPSFLPDEAGAHADAVVIGDAEAVWQDVVRDARVGVLQPTYRAREQPPLAGVVYDRSVFRGQRYPRISAVQVGRGCRFACDFCSIHAFYGSHVRHRPIDEVIAEVASLGRRSVLFVDDNLFIDRAHAAALFEALIPLRITWGCQVSIDIADDPDLVRLMARSGCVAALIGFESLDADNLRQMHKAWSVKGRRVEASIERLHAAGIMVYGSFVFGYDHDTPDTITKTVDFALANKLFLANISLLTPMPGSGLYDRLRNEGRLLSECWWLDPAYRYGDVTFQPAGMSPRTLAARCHEARARFYTLAGMAERLWRSPANARTLRHLSLFLGANLVSRRELASKFGRPLGSREAWTPQSAHAL